MSDTEINELTNIFDNFFIDNSLIKAYIIYNNKNHNNFNDYLINNYDYNNEILLDINELFRRYTTEVKNDLLKYNIYNINERSPEFLICILAYIDNYFDSDSYYNVYIEAMQNL